MELNATIIVQLAIFLFGVLWLSFILFRPMLTLLEERDKRIEGTKREAEKLGSAGTEKSGIIDIRLEEARAAALDERKSFRLQGQKVYTEAVEVARKASQEKLAKARVEIEAARKQAETSLKSEAKVLANMVVERVLERPGGAQ